LHGAPDSVAVSAHSPGTVRLKSALAPVDDADACASLLASSWRTGVIQNFRRFGLALICALPATAALAGDGRLIIRYNMTVAGLPIGSAALNLTVSEDGAYKIVASAKVGGVLSLINDGKGSATALGKVGATQPISSGYALNSISSDKRQTVRMALAAGTVTQAEMNPEQPVRADRVPVTDADKKGVIDPLSAFILPVSGKGDMLDRSACQRNLPIFDGAQRFDIKLSYSRMEHVSLKGGYDGNALVCAVRYVPIAGHRAGREQTRFMAENTDMEIWLAPVAGTRVLAPCHMVIGTQVGRLVFDAAKFIQPDAALATAN
jgi:Protein of unknown function (DUF3108)